VTTSTLHILFSPTAAGCLRQALRDAGRKDRVACYVENLALGPINPPDLQMRQHWIEEELRCKDLSELETAEADAFWKAARAEDVRRVAWMSRRSAPEYCGFLEWLLRLGDLPCEVIDFTNLPVGLRRAFSPALLSPKDVVANAVWDRAEVLDEDARAHFHSLWRRLRDENAPLRVVDADGLRSAPITFFDQQLLSFASADWQKPARIIGYTMAEWGWADNREPYYQAGDGILAARIIALVELGVLEGRGSLMDIRQSEVRLRNQALSGAVPRSGSA
jgi:hypothetical protein